MVSTITSYRNITNGSNIFLSSARQLFHRSKSTVLKCVSKDIQANEDDLSCISINISSLVKTLFESDDINILSQHRLKIPQTNLIPAVIFYNGSFTPIHADHINMLQEAKRYINNLEAHELLAAYISPSHSEYIAKQLKPKYVIGVGHRLFMIQLAIENLGWVMIDLFEIFQSYYTRSSSIMKAFISRVRSQLPNAEQELMYFG